MLICKNVSWQPDSNAVLQNISFELHRQKHLLILGPSGSGKTSLLNILGGLLKPDSGEILFGETNLYKLSEEKRDLFRGKNIGFIFQNFHLIKAFSVRQNLTLAADFGDVKISENEIKNILKSLNLENKIDSKVENLSIGQIQRVAVARALVNKPKWILADEPTSALDDKNCHELISLLEAQAAHFKASLLIVTHDQRVKNHFTDHNIIQL